LFFGILSVFAIASGIVTITSKNPITCALSLVFHFFMLAGLYLTLQAQFLAVVQILIYAGAIMVLVVFVIMLLNLKKEESLNEPFNYKKIIAVSLASVFVVQILTMFLFGSAARNGNLQNTIRQGTIESIAGQLFTNYLFPFEAISLLLLAAIVGSVILAKRNID
jgi:NADH-quinone oxidoreductase subunit J